MLFLPILFFVMALCFFIFSLYRFPFGSFQNVICLLAAMAFMYLAMSLYVIPQVASVVNYPAYNVIMTSNTGITTTSYTAYNVTTYSTINTNVTLLEWMGVYLFETIAIVFALFGIIFRLAGKK